MKLRRFVALVAAIAICLPAVAAAAGPAKGGVKSKAVLRGEYLVTLGGCNDCHTPLAMGPNGPMPDMTKMLSGHPEGFVMPPIKAEGPWLISFAATMTACSGPWGVSFAANLTPDKETGVLRDFTEQQFIQTMRTGKHQGQGRMILPPMPWPNYALATEEDLKAIYAYLMQIPPIRNKVPDPVPPAASTAPTTH